MAQRQSPWKNWKLKSACLKGYQWFWNFASPVHVMASTGMQSKKGRFYWHSGTGWKLLCISIQDYKSGSSLGVFIGGGGLRPLQHTFKEPNSKNARSFNSTQSFINSKRKAILKVVYHISESSLKYYTTFWLSSILRDKLKSSHWKSGTKFLFSGNVAKFPVTIG